MGDPLDLLGTLLDLVGPFLFPVALFVLGVAGYGVLVALGRAGVLDTGRAERDGPTDGDAVEGGREGGEDRRERSRGR